MVQFQGKDYGRFHVKYFWSLNRWAAVYEKAAAAEAVRLPEASAAVEAAAAAAGSWKIQPLGMSPRCFANI